MNTAIDHRHRPIHKVLWGVDPDEMNQTLDQHTYDAIRMLARAHPLTIEPVYVHTPDPAGLNEGYDPHWEFRERNRARRSLRLKLQLMGVNKDPDMSAPVILTSSRLSIPVAARVLARYARNVNADLIAVGTHARQGFSRLFNGSFAESLMSFSKVPVLTVSPNAHVEDRFRSILFPTSFTPECTPTFMKVLDLARDLQSRITLFHSIAVANPMEFSFPSDGALRWLDEYEKWAQELKNRDPIKNLDETKAALCREWMAAAAKYGIPIQLTVTYSNESVADSIIHHIEKNPVQLIAMESHDSPFMSALAGSTSRKIERQAPCPVWVQRH